MPIIICRFEFWSSFRWPIKFNSHCMAREESDTLHDVVISNSLNGHIKLLTIVVLCQVSVPSIIPPESCDNRLNYDLHSTHTSSV